MKYRIIFILIAVSIFQLACSEPREKTTTGAAAGGLVGASLGAIVGNQVGNTGEGLVLGALAGAGTGATVGNAFDGQDAIMRNQDEAIERQERMISAQQSEMEELRKLSQDQISFKGDLQRELSASNNANKNDFNPAAGYKWPERPRGEVRKVENTTNSINPINSMPVKSAVRPAVPSQNLNNNSLASTRLAERDLTPSAQTIPDRPLPINDSANTNQGAYSWRDVAVKDPTVKDLADKDLVQNNSVVSDIQQNLKTVTQIQVESDPIDINKVDSQSTNVNQITDQQLNQVAAVGNNDCAQGSNEARMASSASETADKLFHYRRALRFCPDNADFHNGLGEVYISLNRTEDARYEFQEALRINPSHSAARANLSNL